MKPISKAHQTFGRVYNSSSHHRDPSVRPLMPRLPAARPRDPGILNEEQTQCEQSDLSGSRGRAAGSRSVSGRAAGSWSVSGRAEGSWGMNCKGTLRGFTLIEVLLALAVIAIALTALLKVSSQNIDTTHRIKEKTISHWIAMQGVSMIQLNLVQVSKTQESTQVTSLLGQRWYWRAKMNPTPFKSVLQITISVSQNQSGPFREELTAFRYLA